MASLEQSLARTEADAEVTLTSANKVVSAIKKFRVHPRRVIYEKFRK